MIKQKCYFNTFQLLIEKIDLKILKKQSFFPLIDSLSNKQQSYFACNNS